MHFILQESPTTQSCYCCVQELLSVLVLIAAELKTSLLFNHFVMQRMCSVIDYVMKLVQPSSVQNELQGLQSGSLHRASLLYQFVQRL